MADILESEHRIPRNKLTAETRLREDLGIDGDDAVELFEAIHREHGVDFTPLQHQWSEFFAVEGLSSGEGLRLLAVMIASATAFASGAVVGGMWAGICSLVVAVTVICLVAAKCRRRMRSVTLGGLANIMSDGRWPVCPDQVG